MNRQFSSFSAALVFLGAIIMIGCNGGNQNAVVNTNANANANSIKTPDSASLVDIGHVDADAPPCTNSEVVTGVESDFGNGSLQDQYRNHWNFRVVDRNDTTGSYQEMYVEGSLGTGLDHKDQMFHLQRDIRKFVRRNCVRSVYFVPPGTFKSGAPLLAQGFRWYAYCEDGKDPCSDGSCSRPCPVMLSGNEKGANSANGNSNSNSGANGNSNKP
jgi:hypothetical protein